MVCYKIHKITLLQDVNYNRPRCFNFVDNLDKYVVK